LDDGRGFAIIKMAVNGIAYLRVKGGNVVSFGDYIHAYGAGDVSPFRASSTTKWISVIRSSLRQSGQGEVSPILKVREIPPNPPLSRGAPLSSPSREREKSGQVVSLR
jgi:hypothetical protein